MEKIIEALRFIAENRQLSNDELADGLAVIDCDWTWDEWKQNFGGGPEIGLFEGVRLGLPSCGASVVINMGSRNDFNRFIGDEKFLSVDDETSVYYFIRLVTGDSSFTKENIDRRQSS